MGNRAKKQLKEIRNSSMGNFFDIGIDSRLLAEMEQIDKILFNDEQIETKQRAASTLSWIEGTSEEPIPENKETAQSDEPFGFDDLKKMFEN